MKMHFILLALVMYLLSDGYGTTFGFSHDSLNLLNSGKFIWLSYAMRIFSHALDRKF